MHVNTKKLAISGLLAAFSAVMMVLASVIETSSLFFICAASFTAGIVIREWGFASGAAYLAASTLVNLLAAPDKLYCVTCAALELYLLFSEFLWKRIAAARHMRRRTLALWAGKYAFFNLLYIPALLFFQELLFAKRIAGVLLFAAFAAGQAALFLYDAVYRYFQGTIWARLRARLMQS